MKLENIQFAKKYIMNKERLYLKEGAIVIPLYKEGDNTICVQDLSLFRYGDGQWWCQPEDLDELG